MLNRYKKIIRIFFIGTTLAAGLALGMTQKQFGVRTNLAGIFHGAQPGIPESLPPIILEAKLNTDLVSATAQGEKNPGYSKWNGSGKYPVLDAFNSRRKFQAWFEQDFKSENLILHAIRKSLATGEKIEQLPQSVFDLPVEFFPTYSWVSLSLFEPGNLPIRYISKRKDFLSTLNRIVQKLRSNKHFSKFSVDDCSKCRLLIEVLITQRPIKIKNLNFFKLDKERFEPGITGIRIDYRRRNHIYMPTDAVVKSHLTLKAVLNDMAKKIGIAKKTNSISGRIKILRELDAKFYLTSSIAFISFRDRIVPLYRGYPMPVVFSLDTIFSMTAKSIDWLQSNMESNGKFLYYYDPVKDTTIDHLHPNRSVNNNYYNILRHCGGILSLLKMYELTGNQHLLKSSEAALSFLVRHIREYNLNGQKAHFVFYNKKAKLGGSGIGLVAFLRFRLLTGKTNFDKYIYGIANHLLSRIDSEGQFIGYYIHPLLNDGKPIVGPSEKTKRRLFSFYYPGEALLGLALFDQQMDIDQNQRKKMREKCTLAIDFLVNIRPVRYPNLFRPLPSDGWLMQAIEEWSKVEGFSKQNHLDFVFKDSQKLIEHMYQTDDSPYFDYPGSFYYFFGEHAYIDGARAEGLISAYYLAKRIGKRKLANHILNHCKLAAFSLMHAYNSPESTYMHRYPSKSIGSFKFKYTRQWVRVDTVQHANCFYLRFLKASNAENPSFSKLRAREKITSHFKRRCIPPDCVAKARNMPDIPVLSRLARRAPQH
jgi:hypothetical protein